MFLAKLRAVVAVALVALVGAGVGGLAYRTGAAEPQRPAAPTRTQVADDDLEALRLEVDAVRKGLQATRERVKLLESEVQALKLAPQPLGGLGGLGALGVGGGNLGALGGGNLGVLGGGNLGVLGGPVQGQMPPGAVQGPVLGHLKLAQPKAPEDPLAEAEAALKKLRENPKDKQATDALERAVNRLKERDRPEAGKE